MHIADGTYPEYKVFYSPKVLTNSVVPAFDALYANPAIASRLNPAILLVPMTWDFCSRFPLAFPASRRGRKARTEKNIPVTLTLDVLVKAWESVAQSVSWS